MKAGPFSSRLQNFFVLVAITAIYFATGQLGLKLAFLNQSATAIWPPTGIALASFLLFGYQVWPAIFAGAWLVNIATTGILSQYLISDFFIATGNTLEGMLGAFLVNRFANGRKAFLKAVDVFKFIFFAAILSTTLSATIGVTSLCLGGLEKWSNYGSVWFTWWFGDVGGALIVTPLLILWAENFRFHWKWKKVLEFSLALLLICLVGNEIFGNENLNIKIYSFPFLCTPPLLWVAFRFGQRETISAIFLTAMIAIIGTFHGLGPFPKLATTENEAFILLQVFISISAMTFMSFSAAVFEQKQANELLCKFSEEVRSRLAAVVESSQDAIVSTNLDAEILTWNRGAEMTFGYSVEEMKGKSTLILTPEELYDERLGQLNKVRSGERIEPFETVRLKKNGERINISLSYSPIYGANGKIFGISLIGRDISRRKKMEETLAQQRKELERSNLELKEFAHAAAHDLQEPIRMVKSYVQLLAKKYQGQLDSKADEFISYIVSGVFRMQELISGLLSYSEIGNRQKELEMIDCQPILENALTDLRIAIAESGALITYDKLPSVRIHSRELGQLFLNLISNAIKFRAQQAPQIHISAEKKDRYDLFSIRDNGIGVAPQYFEKIFVMFNRLHSRTEYPGSGIGLALCKKIVEQRGGRIWVESQAGKGSIFFFTIPNSK